MPAWWAYLEMSACRWTFVGLVAVCLLVDGHVGGNKSVCGWA